MDFKSTPDVSNLAELSDLDLLELTRAGNDTAYGVLWHRHRTAGLRAARSITDKIEPEDMLQEAFTRILSAIHRQSGPREAFRPYMYSVLRSISMGWNPNGGVLTPIHEVLPNREPSYSFEGTSLDKTVTSRAFVGLKPEWRKVLWYIEVEGMPPRDVAPLLGLTPNAVSALAVRAKEGLRVSWLQAHLKINSAAPGCQWFVDRLGAYNRSALTATQHSRFTNHLASCESCTILLEEIDEVGRNLGLTLLPLLLGPTTLTSLASPATTGKTVAAQASRAAPDLGSTVVTARLVAAKLPILTAAAVVLIGGLAVVLANFDVSSDVNSVSLPATSTVVPETIPSTVSARPDHVATELFPQDIQFVEVDASDRNNMVLVPLPQYGLPHAVNKPVSQKPAPSPPPHGSFVEPGSCTDGYTRSFPEPDGVPGSVADGEPNARSVADGNTESDTGTFAHAHPNPGTFAHAHPNPDTNAHPNPDTFAHASAGTDANANGDANS